MIDVWEQLATFSIRSERYDQAVDAYKHIIELKPTQTTAYLGAAGSLLKLKNGHRALRHALPLKVAFALCERNPSPL